MRKQWWVETNDRLTTTKLDALKCEIVRLHLKKNSTHIVNCYCNVDEPYNPNIDRYRIEWLGDYKKIAWKTEDDVIYTGSQLCYDGKPIAQLERIPEDTYYTKQIEKLDNTIKELKQTQDMDQDRLWKTSDYETQTLFRKEVTEATRNLVDLIRVISSDKRTLTMLEQFKDFVTSHKANHMNE